MTQKYYLVRKTSKLLPKFVGPFEVLEPSGNINKNPNNVWLKTPRSLRIHMPHNVKDVRRYIARPDRLGGVPNLDAPLPITSGTVTICGKFRRCSMRTDKKTRCSQALVVWQGFGVESVRWEPVANLPKAVLDEYHTLQKQAAVLFAELDDNDSESF